MSIRILPEHVVNKIAAGEVIERPASVVKELIENSIDAGADEIEIEVKEGGRRLIRVSDNGCGMSKEDLLLSTQRHATSKIYREEDLYSISTLGFRGEALFSIASVSRMRITARTKDSISGNMIYLEGGKLFEVRETGAPVGTSVEVMDIFYNYPVRLKFMKHPRRELEQVIEVLHRFSLSNNEIRFKLISNGEVLMNLERVSDPRDRVIEIFGKEIGENLYEIEGGDSGIGVKGFISKPGVTRANQRDIYIYVNGRYIRDRLVTHAILEGYKGLIDKERFPVAIIFIKLHPSMMDVNVHPTKLEVRFKNPGIIYESVYRLIKKRLHIPEYKPLPEQEARVMETVLTYSSIPTKDRVKEVTIKPPKEGGLFKEGRFSSLNIIGQLWESYIVCESPEELILIDQHAAHERIIFEKLKKNANRLKKTLLIPKIIELNLRDSEILKEYLDYFYELGLEIEIFGKREFIIKTAPEILPYQGLEAIIIDLVEELSSFDKSLKMEEIKERIIKGIACHNSIRAHYKEEYPEMRALLKDMDGLESSFCPHGRPIEIRFSKGEIERRFKRR